MRQQATGKDEEIRVLQVGLDESLERLHELQQSADAAKQQHELRLRALHDEHARELNRLLDDLLTSCAHKIDETAVHFDSPLYTGNQSATARSPPSRPRRSSRPWPSLPRRPHVTLPTRRR